MAMRREARGDVGVRTGSGGAEGADLSPNQRQLIFNMQFELFQANFLELLVFRKPGFLEQGFELLRIVTMLFFQATYCFTIRLTVRFKIHRRHLRFGITSRRSRGYFSWFAGRIGLTTK